MTDNPQKPDYVDYTLTREAVHRLIVSKIFVDRTNQFKDIFGDDFEIQNLSDLDISIEWDFENDQSLFKIRFAKKPKTVTKEKLKAIVGDVKERSKLIEEAMEGAEGNVASFPLGKLHKKRAEAAAGKLAETLAQLEEKNDDDS